MTRPAELLADGLKHHREGRLAEARVRYEALLRIEPRHADALHFLGLVAYQEGNAAAGQELIRRALELNAHAAAYHNSLGECCRALRQFAEARRCYERALALDPSSADAHANLGSLLASIEGDVDGGMAHLRTALQLRPNDPRNLVNLGNACFKAQRYREAVEPSRQATRLAPGFWAGWLNFGIALYHSGQAMAAIDALTQAAKLNAAEADIFTQLGKVFWDIGNFDRAADCCARAVELRPGVAEHWSNWGLVAQRQGLLTRAVAHLERSLDLEPQNAAAWNNLGTTLSDMAEHLRALECFDRALACPAPHSEPGSNRIYTRQFSTAFTASEICALAREWGDAVISAVGFVTPSRAAAPPAARLRIGYVSADFRAHPIAYFMAGPLAARDHSRFEVFCYSSGAHEDEWTRRIESVADQWVAVAGLSDAEMAARIARDGLDLLIDLGGHTAKNRLGVFARRPAPRQATYLGYPGSTGLRTVDYRISDRLADPPEASVGHYVEELAWLDRCAWCYTPPLEESAAPIDRSRREGGVVFGCFNHYAKISPEVLALWAEVLRTVEGSTLVLKANSLSDPDFVRLTRERFAAASIDVDRLELLGRSPGLPEHFASYNRVDIALDTYPYHGTTTTCDALWMGVPLVTLRGARHSCRVGCSLLKTLGLGDLVADTPEAYVRLAARLAADGPRRAELHATLRGRMRRSEIMDAAGMARSLEALLLRLAQR